MCLRAPLQLNQPIWSPDPHLLSSGAGGIEHHPPTLNHPKAKCPTRGSHPYIREPTLLGLFHPQPAQLLNLRFPLLPMETQVQVAPHAVPSPLTPDEPGASPCGPASRGMSHPMSCER